MSARALLINPPIYDFAAFDLWLKPLGLLSIASALEGAGLEVQLVDCLDRLHPVMPPLRRKGRPRLYRFGCGDFPAEEIPKPSVFSDVRRRFKRYGLPKEVLEKQLRSVRLPNVIAITSTMTYWYPAVFDMVETCRQLFPDIPIILGGVYATLCNEHARSKSGADFVISGRGEEEVVRLACELCGTSPAPSGDERPRLAYHLYSKLRYASIVTSEGCPFRCTYCASHVLSPRFRQFEPEVVVEEISGLVERFHIRDIAVFDDALLVNAERHIVPIMEGLLARDLKVRLHTPNGLHASMITPDVARLMRRAGFKTIRMGFESCSEYIQEASHYKVSMEQLSAALRYLRGAGYGPRDTEVYIIVGVPGQRPDEIDETLRFVHEQRGWMKLTQFSPIPGTEQFGEAKGRLPEIADEPLLQNNSTYLIMSGAFTHDSLKALKVRANALNRSLL